MLPERAFESGSQYPARKPGTLRLYSMRFCPYVKRTLLVLEHKNIPCLFTTGNGQCDVGAIKTWRVVVWGPSMWSYEIVNINLSKKPEWYLERINCLGLVPTIENDDVIVFDSIIINEYLDSMYPDNKLLPSDPYQAAKDKMLLEVWSKVVTQYYRVFYPTGNEEDPISQMLLALDRLENELKARKSKFFGGDTPMMIDFNIWPHMERVNHFDVLVPDFKLDAVRFKHLKAYVERMLLLPAVEKNKLRVDWFKLFVESIRKGEIDYNVGLEE